MPRREIGRTLLTSEREGFLVVRPGPLLAPTAFTTLGKGEERGDASFVNHDQRQPHLPNNVPAPVSSSNTAESIQGQRAA
jgi:hypothetical protein